MRRRKVILSIEVETVLTIGELKKLSRVHLLRSDGAFQFLSTNEDDEKESFPGCVGTIKQVHVNVVKK